MFRILQTIIYIMDKSLKERVFEYILHDIFHMRQDGNCDGLWSTNIPGAVSIMKSLYFVCLSSCEVVLNEGVVDKQDMYRKSLFRIFDDFTTYPLCMVSHEIQIKYINIGQNSIRRFNLNSEWYYNSEECGAIQSSYEWVKDNHCDIAKLVDESILFFLGGGFCPNNIYSRSKKVTYDICDINKQMFIDVSSSFPAWITSNKELNYKMYECQGFDSVSKLLDGNNAVGNINKALTNNDTLTKELDAFMSFRREHK